jgi:O-antigen/teichoic acid export membrane protein
MLLVLAFPAVTIFIGGYHDIVNVLFGDNFKKISPMLIPCVAIGTFIIGIKSYYLDQVFYIKKATKIQAFILLGVATLNTILNVVFIPMYGYEVAAINSVVSFGVATVITYNVGKKLINIPFPWSKFYKLLLASFSMYVVLWLLPDSISTFMLAVKLILGLLTYLLLVILLNKSEVSKLWVQLKGLKV